MKRLPDAAGHFGRFGGRFVPETLMATDDLEAQIRALRLVTTKPVCVGFGIGRPEQAAAIGRLADGVIVGSAIVRLVEERAASASLVSDVGDFIASLKAPLRGGPARERVGRGA